MSAPTDATDRKRLSDDLETTFFVEAGAGTGKTRELVARIVALVASGRLTMPGLAAITFTTAAAAELRDRIRRELAQAAVDAERWTDAQRQVCLEASRSVDLAHIQTIHAFAGDLLRTFPLEAELPPGFAIWDEMQRDRDFDERFRAWLYDEVPGSDRTARREAVAKALMLGLQPERLKLLTQRLQEHYDLLTPESSWEHGDPPDPVRVANESGAELRALDDVLDCSRLGDADELYRTVRGLEFTVQQLVAARTEPEAFEAMLRYLLKKPNPMRSSPDNWDEHPTLGNPLPYIRETLRAASTRIEAAIETHRSSALADLLGYLAEFTLAYARDRKQRGVATFHDLLVWSRDLLRDHPRVREAAQQRIQRLFVDEFQDTDPLQAELVAYLVADPALAAEQDWHVLLRHLVPGRLFVVGDPKQSIYRFRRAEVAVYHKVYAAADQPGASTADARPDIPFRRPAGRLGQRLFRLGDETRSRRTGWICEPGAAPADGRRIARCRRVWCAHGRRPRRPQGGRALDCRSRRHRPTGAQSRCGALACHGGDRRRLAGSPRRLSRRVRAAADAHQPAPAGARLRRQQRAVSHGERVAGGVHPGSARPGGLLASDRRSVRPGGAGGRIALPSVRLFGRGFAPLGRR